MIVTAVMVLVILALILAVVAAAGRAPLWVAVVLLALVELLRVLPVK